MSSLKTTVFIFLFSLSAHADRWLVKNPTTMDMSRLDSGASIYNQISINDSDYLVVNTPADTRRSVMLFESERNRVQAAFQAEVVGPDLKIGLVESRKSSRIVSSAWHTQTLHYAEMPKGFDGAGVIVAVLDTGVDVNHTALKNHLWVNKNEIAGNGIDDDKNGFVDDVNGYSFSENMGAITDVNGHGTHCAGLIAASPKDTSANSPRGIAQGAKVMGVQIIGENTDTFLSDAAKGVQYAVDNGAKVLSNSWRIYESWTGFYNEAGLALLEDAIHYTEKHEAVFLEAAGNETKNVDLLVQTDPIYPLNLQNVAIFSVAAATQKNSLAYFSNYGVKTVNVAAPGVGILSTYPNNAWESMDGTSMATPIAAGAVALGVGAGLSPKESVELLQSTSNAEGWEKYIQSGEIDLVAFAKAIQAR